MKRGEFALGILLILFSLGLTFALLSIDSPSRTTGLQVADLQELQSGNDGTRGTLESRSIQVVCTSCADCTTCAATAGNTCTLSNDINSTTTCITLAADNVTLDCNGNRMNFSTAGGSTNNGITSTSRTNLAIRNCLIVDTNSLGSTGIGISFTSVNSSLIENNTINTSGTASNFAIRLNTASTNNIIRNNTLTARGTSSSNFVIYLLSSSSNTIIQHNSLTAIGASSGSIGIKAETSIFNTTVFNNTIRTMGVGVSNYGIAFDVGSTGNNTIDSNNISTNGTSASSNNAGVRLVGSTRNNVTNNIINTNGTSFNHGVTIVTVPCHNNTVFNNTIFARGNDTGNRGISLESACGDNIVRQNNVSTFGTSANLGIGLFNGEFFASIRDNTIFSSGSTDQNQGISLTTSLNINVTNNTIRTNGTSSNHGIFIVTGSNNTRIENNSVTTTGTSINNVGIAVNTNGRNNTIAFNIVTTNGTSSNFGIELTTSTSNNVIHSNIVRTNGTFDNRGINNIAQSHNTQIYNNTVYTSGSGVSQYGIAQSDSNNLTTYNNTVVTFGSGDQEAMFLQRGNDSTIYNNFLTTTGTGGTNVGLWILDNAHRNNATNNTINTTGSSTNNHGIYVNNNADNTRVENNTIYTNGTSDNVGIRIEANADNNVIRNNTIATNGTENTHGVALVGATLNNNLVEYNTIRTNTIDLTSSGGFGVGVNIAASPSTNTTVQHNRIFTAGGPFSWGIGLDSGVSSLIYNNTISTNGTSQNMGIRLDTGAANNTVRGNNVTTDGSNTSNFGISVSRALNTTVENNVVLTYSNASNGLRVASFSNNTYFVNNTVSTRGTNSYGIAVGITAGGGGSGGGGADRNSFINTSLINVTQWIQIIGSNFTNFTNTSFQTGNGSITIEGNFSLNGTLNITRTQLNTQTNRAFITTSSVPQLNTSALIALFGILTINPRLIVDFNDDGLAFYCDSPQCTLLSFSGGTLRFNVSSFTTYSSAGNVSVEKSDNPDPVGAGSQLSYTIFINNTGNDTVFNVTAVETYASGLAFVSSSPTANVSNNTWLLGNLSNGTSTTINITLNVSASIPNGTVLNNTVNVTFSNTEGINVLVVDTENTTVFSCPFNISQSLTLTSNITCPATAVNILADNVILDCNGKAITYSTTSAGNGIAASNVRNVTVLNCIILQGAGISTSHALSFTSVNNSRILNTTANATGLASNGIFISSNSNNDTVVSSTASSSSINGIVASSSSNISIINSTGIGASGLRFASVNVGLINNSVGNGAGSGMSIELGTCSNVTVSHSNASNTSGVSVFVTQCFNSILQNITAISTFSPAIQVQNSFNNTLISLNGTSGSSDGIQLSIGRNITLANSTGVTNLFSSGITTQLLNDSILTGNTGRSTSSGTGISITLSSRNVTFHNNTATVSLVSPSSTSLLISSSHNNTITNNSVSGGLNAVLVTTSTGNYFANNTIANPSFSAFHLRLSLNGTLIEDNFIPNGTHSFVINETAGVIAYIQTVNFTSAANLSRIVNVTLNNTFVNSTNSSALNRSAQLTLFGIAFTDPRPVTSLNDGGFFEFCNSPRCVEVSYSGGAFVFNVSSFTSYASAETGNINITVTKSDAPDPVNNGSTLSYTITINNSGTDTAVNVTLLENYPANTTFNGSSPAPSSGNNFFFLGNLTGGSSITVNITVNVSENMTSGTLNNTVNVSFLNTTGANITVNVSELTSVTTPGAPAPAPSGGGGGIVIFRNAQINRTLPQVLQPVVQQAAATVQAAPAPTIIPPEPILEPILAPIPQPAPQVEPQPIPLPETRSETAIWPVIALIALALLTLAVMTRREPPAQPKPSSIQKLDDDVKELRAQIARTKQVLKHRFR